MLRRVARITMTESGTITHPGAYRAVTSLALTISCERMRRRVCLSSIRACTLLSMVRLLPRLDVAADQALHVELQIRATSLFVEMTQPIRSVCWKKPAYSPRRTALRTEAQAITRFSQRQCFNWQAHKKRTPSCEVWAQPLLAPTSTALMSTLKILGCSAPF